LSSLFYPAFFAQPTRSDDDSGCQADRLDEAVDRSTSGLATVMPNAAPNQ
jgi:hypothetical protein